MYKRQAKEQYKALGLQPKEFVKTRSGELEPVSYTHLDVYKRQDDSLPRIVVEYPVRFWCLENESGWQAGFHAPYGTHVRTG